MATRFGSKTASTFQAVDIESILEEIKNKEPIVDHATKMAAPMFSPYTMEANTDEGVSAHSGVMIFDIDPLGDEVIENRDQIKNWLKKDEFVYFVYYTGRGIHFAVDVAVTPTFSAEAHSVLYDAIKTQYQSDFEKAGFEHNVKWDAQTSNIGRRWFIHGDKDIWIRQRRAKYLGHGNRNVQFTSLYGRITAFRQDAQEMLKRINTGLEAPLAESELTGITESIGKISSVNKKSKGSRLHQQIDAVRSWFGQDLRYDVYQDSLTYKGLLVSDEQLTKLRTELERETRVSIQRADFREFVSAVGLENPYDWFHEWLEAEAVTQDWHNMSIGNKLIVCAHCEYGCDACSDGVILPDDKAEWAGRWLRLVVDGMVGRNIIPGARFPYVPYILGSQGVAKSDLLKVLASGGLGENNYALVPDLEFYKGDIDTIYASQGVLVFEDGEALVSARVQHNAQKRFATETVDRGLKKWKVMKTNRPRRYIVVVTSNERQHFPKGETRRFPVLDLPTDARINLDWLIENRSNLLRSRYGALKDVLPRKANSLVLEEEWWAKVEEANIQYKWTDETDDFADDIRESLESAGKDNNSYGVRSKHISNTFNKRIRELRPALEQAGLESKVVRLAAGGSARMWVIKGSKGPYTIHTIDDVEAWQ